MLVRLTLLIDLFWGLLFVGAILELDVRCAAAGETEASHKYSGM